MFLLQSRHRGDFIEYTQYTIFNIKKENQSKLSQICNYGILFQGTQENKFETTVEKEPSVFEPLKFYCIMPSLFQLNLNVSNIERIGESFFVWLLMNNVRICKINDVWSKYTFL